MQIVTNNKGEILRMLLLGSRDDGIEVEIPQEVQKDPLGSWLYRDGRFIKNEEYVPPVPLEEPLEEPPVPLVPIPAAVPSPLAERVAVLEALALEREYREAAQVLECETTQVLECETTQALECETTQALERETTQALEREPPQALERTPLQDQKRESSASPGEGKGLLKRLFRGKARGERDGQR